MRRLFERAAADTLPIPMLTSVRWLNDYLDPPADAEEQAELLTRAGFPLEGRETVDLDGPSDVRQDFEMTSNRGDCVCHVGLAREIAAISGRELRPPERAAATGDGGPARDHVEVVNEEPALCPRYTARIIRGVTVRPSPAWLAERLTARGDIPRNNVVDATNFVLFELGQPTHCFDLATLRGGKIIIRRAHPGEPFLPIGEGAAGVKLSPDDLVIADAERALAMAGVKGGALTAVSETTTDLLLEAATFDPVSVRNTSRRYGIASDSSYRFERGVHPGQIDDAAMRLASLIVELAGGTICEGVVEDGAPIPAPRRVSMRPDRCRRILGVEVTDDEMVGWLERLGFVAERDGDRIACVVPVHRLDIEREIDLIEEVSRMFGLDNIPVTETIRVRVAPPQATEMAHIAVADLLVGEGFLETITHSLVGEAAAIPFLPARASALRVDDDRAKSEPILRPSVLPSLLRVRGFNQDHGVDHLRLFESAATFWDEGGCHHERVRLGLLMDVEDEAAGLRPMRGVVERLVGLLAGSDAAVAVTTEGVPAWLAPGGGALAVHDGRVLGPFGRLVPDVERRFQLDRPVLVGELDLAHLIERFPPETEAHALPSFPAIDRDLSAIVDETVTWAAVEAAVRELELEQLESCAFVTTFRGKQVGAGRKSLTMRLRFRAEDRTLTHDEVDPRVDAVIETLRRAIGAEIRK
jgi:phenylalanyl-tRNA synthetase beta chain